MLPLSAEPAAGFTFVRRSAARLQIGFNARLESTHACCWYLHYICEQWVLWSVRGTWTGFFVTTTAVKKACLLSLCRHEVLMLRTCFLCLCPISSNKDTVGKSWPMKRVTIFIQYVWSTFLAWIKSSSDDFIISFSILGGKWREWGIRSQSFLIWHMCSSQERYWLSISCWFSQSDFFLTPQKITFLNPVTFQVVILY